MALIGIEVQWCACALNGAVLIAVGIGLRSCGVFNNCIVFLAVRMVQRVGCNEYKLLLGAPS
jgi:hypothetical protein